MPVSNIDNSYLRFSVRKVGADACTVRALLGAQPFFCGKISISNASTELTSAINSANVNETKKDILKGKEEHLLGLIKKISPLSSITNSNS